jgi:hypothetical protein
MDPNIVEAFRIYAKDPAKWFRRYQDACRAFPETWNKIIKECNDAEKKRQQKE